MLAAEYKSKYLNELKVVFNNVQEQINEAEINKLKEELDNTTQFLEDAVVALSDVTNGTLLYLSPNIEKLSGFSRAESYQLNSFSRIVFSHYSYPFKMLKYSKRFGENLSPQEIRSSTFASCGLKLKDKWGQKHKLLVKSSVLTLDKSNKLQIMIEQWENISPIYKGEHYWARWKCPDHRTFAFVNQRGKKEYTELVSPREEEIVELVTQGKSNQMIADILHLSKSTIETHRKNILRKTGFTSIEAFSYIWNRIK